MIAYRYKLYTTKKTRSLDRMMAEAAFVWNHALALQRRYYSLYHGYVSCARMQKHFARCITRHRLHSQSVQEIIQRLDLAYSRFFTHKSGRPPKFKRSRDFTSIVFKGGGGCCLSGNTVRINKTGKRYKFSLSREYTGKIKLVTFKRDACGDYYVIITTDACAGNYGKTHDGASVGIDAGLKVSLVMSDGSVVRYPRFLMEATRSLKEKGRKLSGTKKGSRHHEHRRMDLAREYRSVVNRRDDYQWKLAHELCRKYDRIFIEDLVLTGMTRMWGRKMSDMAHGKFLLKLDTVASKYGVSVHRIDRYYPSSRTCTCGHINQNLTLKDRKWTCPVCGQVHDRDLLAANNILRKGISELESAK